MSYSGVYLVALARRVIETFLKEGIRLDIPSDAPRDLFDESGAFVTLRKIDQFSQNPTLRGCIGRIESPNSSLIQSTIDSAIDAAIHDPRFPPVTIEEMSDLIIEVTILTPATEIRVKDPMEYLDKIIIGKHGLIAKRGYYNRGLLLPQVPVEQNPPWNVETYLQWVCMKAGLCKDAWYDLNTTVISSFEGIIFSELKPNGPIIQKQHELS